MMTDWDAITTGALERAGCSFRSSLTIEGKVYAYSIDGTCVAFSFEDQKVWIATKGSLKFGLRFRVKAGSKPDQETLDDQLLAELGL